MTAVTFRQRYLPTLAGSVEDTSLDALITTFDAVSAGRAGWRPASIGGGPSWLQASYTHYLDGPDLDADEQGVDAKSGEILALPHRPVASVTSIHDDVDRVYGTDKLVPSADYELEGEDGLVSLKPLAARAWSSAYRSIKVVYLAGYLTAPDWLVHACGEQVAAWWQARGSQGRVRVSEGGRSAEGAAARLALLPEVWALLAPHALVYANVDVA